MCETFVNRYEPKFTGYTTNWKHRNNRNKGGLLILIREDLRFKLNKLHSFNDGYLEYQSVRVFSDFGAIDVMNIYNPCKDISFEEFDHYRSQLSETHIMIGDFNADSPLGGDGSRANKTGENLEQLIDESNLGVLLCDNYYTYLDRKNGKTTIDIYDYKTLKKVKTLVTSSDIEELQYFSDYKFSDDESQVLLATNEVSIFRRSSLGNYYVLDTKTKKVTANFSSFLINLSM